MIPPPDIERLWGITWWKYPCKGRCHCRICSASVLRLAIRTTALPIRGLYLCTELRRHPGGGVNGSLRLERCQGEILRDKYSILSQCVDAARRLLFHRVEAKHEAEKIFLEAFIQFLIENLPGRCQFFPGRLSHFLPDALRKASCSIFGNFKICREHFKNFIAVVGSDRYINSHGRGGITTRATNRPVTPNHRYYYAAWSLDCCARVCCYQSGRNGNCRGQDGEEDPGRNAHLHQVRTQGRNQGFVAMP